MTDLHARLLAEIERREPDLGPFDDPGPLTTAMMHEHAYLGALRGVVDIHRDWPSTITYSDGTVIEARECRVCMDGECGEICRTLRCVAEALGVTP